MFDTHATRAALAAATLLASLAAQAARPLYRIEVVGPPPSTQSFVGAAINDKGEVAGTLTVDSGTVPAAWQPGGAIQRLGHLPGRGGAGSAAAINNAGQVVGASGRQPKEHAFVWSRRDGMVDLGAQLPEDVLSWATGINDAGQVTIESRPHGDSGLGAQAFTWTQAGGAVPIVPTFAGAAVSVLGINRLGQATGYAGTPTGWEAMIWNIADGSMVTLGRPAGWYDGTSGNAINDLGQVVGTSTVGCCVNAVTWTADGGWQALGYLPNFLGFSNAAAINHAGIIVGGSATGPDAHDVAAIWFPGHAIANLNSFIDPADPLAGQVLLRNAVGINRSGQILANATIAGLAQAVVLTPEP